MSEPMFVISEDELSAIEIILKQAGIPIKRNVLLTEIRSRKLSTELETAYRHGFNDGQAEGMPLELSTDDAIPFSDWLSIHDTTIRKLERERINNELDYIKHTESLQDFFVTVHLCDVRKIVRGEP